MKKELKHVNLKEISNPEFLKTMSYEELNLLSADLRQYIVDVVSENGGHLSSNLGVVESTIALCKSFDFSKDKIVFDVGHQCYTYKILTGRDFTNIRKKDGPSGFPKRSESIYDCYECGHSSTSVSAAMGIAEARDLKKENYHVVAFIGDASFENGLVFEALDHLKRLRTKIIIVVNDNEMSIGKNTESIFSKAFRKLSNSKTYQDSKTVIKRSIGSSKFGRAILKPLAAFKHWLKHRLIAFNVFDVFDIKYIGNVDGHNIKAMEKAFKRAKSFNEPVVVHIKTTKGKGFEYTENDNKGAYHGVGKFNKETGEIQIDETASSWSKEYANRLYNVMKENEKTVVVCPATSLGSSLFEIEIDFKNRFFDVGIAEEHATILSAGLSSNGLHPFISMYSTFLQRSYDQISHDLARMNLSTTLLIDRAGLVGSDGDTHQGIYDSSFLYTIPNCTIAMASSPAQINSLLKESMKNHGVFAIRYSKEKLLKDDNIADEEVKFGEWKGLLKGENTAVISYGPIVKKLAEEIKNKGLNVTVIEAIYTRPILETNLFGLNRYNKIVIYDAYSTSVGFANSLTKSLIKTGYRGEIVIKAIPNEFINHGSIEEQRDQLGISIDKIIDIL